MKRVKILGSGCAKCNQLADVVKAVIAREGIEAMVEKVEDIQQIMAYNVMSTPALVVDEVVICKGRIPLYGEVKEMLTAPAKGCCCGGSSNSSKTSGSCCS